MTTKQLPSLENLSENDRDLINLLRDELNEAWHSLLKYQYGRTENLDYSSEHFDRFVEEASEAAVADALVRFHRLTELMLLLASSEHASETTLTALSTDRRYKVREAVAKNSNTPQALLEVLAKDKDEDVRAAAARSPKVAHLLRDFLSDPFMRVRFAAFHTKELTREDLLFSLRGAWDGYALAVLEHPLMTEADLDNALLSHAKSLRVAAATSRKTPASQLRMLSHDERQSIRVLVAENPSTPEETVAKLLCDPSSQVRSAAAANPRIGIAALLTAAVKGGPATKTMKALMEREAELVEWVAANHESLAPFIGKVSVPALAEFVAVLEREATKS